MRIVAALVFALAVLCRIGAAATRDAAADEYFGQFKMSALQIRMKIDDLGRRYLARTIADHDVIHDAVLAEAALRVWRNKYPNDTWLAPTSFHLEQLYQAVQTPEARKHAGAMLEYVIEYFPNSKYGKLARERKNAGFPALHPESDVTSSPTPAPLVTVTPAATPSAMPTTSAAPTGVPETMTPAPSPSAKATSTPLSARLERASRSTWP